MNRKIIEDFIATVPVNTIGERFALGVAVGWIERGVTGSAAHLLAVGGLGAIPALVAAGAPPAMLREAIDAALLSYHRDLPGFLARSGGRPALAAWCRAAGYTLPEGTPEVVDLYRGTMGCSPAEAAAGLHWTTAFDKAALYACRFADAALTGVIVTAARVPRAGIAAWVVGVVNTEVVPAEAPAAYEVVTDKERIGDAAVRFARKQEILAAEGWTAAPGSVASDRQAEAAAMATRARMAAAGVPRGTAIVS